MADTTLTTVTVKIGSTTTQDKTDTIPPATPLNAGCMTAAQAAAVAGIGPGGATTFATTALLLAAPATQGQFAIASDSNLLYCANGGQWWPLTRLSA